MSLEEFLSIDKGFKALHGIKPDIEISEDDLSRLGVEGF